MTLEEAKSFISDVVRKHGYQDTLAESIYKQISEYPELIECLDENMIISMIKDPQSRKWHIVINNPEEHELGHEKIKSILKQHNLVYFCMMDEIGDQGTYHTHLYIYANSPMRFSTLKRHFPTAHIEKALGTSLENRTYVLKEGKFQDSEKGHTTVKGTFEEQGLIPTKSQESTHKLQLIHKMIEDGYSNLQIIKEFPEYSFRIKTLVELRNEYLREKNSVGFRNLSVTYIYGKTGTGKTYSIFQKHKPENICRVTNYENPRALFDAYEGQDVLVFEEFRSQIPIGDMLNYLDRYPIDLPARYGNRWASFTKVYITSNISLKEQYKSIQEKEPESYKAFLRRIHNVVRFTKQKKYRVERGEFTL